MDQLLAAGLSWSNRIGDVGDGIFSCFELCITELYGVCHASEGVILHFIPLGRLMIWVPLMLYRVWYFRN
jgi:hypothetical protein